MRLFISYGRRDSLDFAIKLTRWLREQGYEPWLDVENGIEIGDQFDIRLERGISGSDILISLLSPWSLRPEGFCRNELLYAQACRIPIVPIRIANIIPPIQIISLNYIDIYDDPESVFTLLPRVIEQVASTGRAPLKDWRTETGSRPWWSARQELNFQEELVKHGGSFIGREWLFEAINTWIKNPDSRMLFITADPGVGKSAIAAQMTTRIHVQGVHFCTSSNFKSCFPRAWLSELIYQLAAQYPDYRKEIEQLNEPNWVEPPESLFRTLVVDPLRSLREGMDMRDPWVFVIDSLDESVAEAGSGLTDLLTRSAERIPEWMRIIVTSRPDQTLIARFSISGVRRLHIETEAELNTNDLRQYIQHRVHEISDGPDASRFIKKISELSAGNFLFAKVLMNSLSESKSEHGIDIGRFDSIPKNLIGLYESIFRSRFRDQGRYENEILPLLNCLVAAKETLPVGALLKASKLDEQTANRGFLALSQFLESSESGIRIFHQSVVDWLTDLCASTAFAASEETGHWLLAETYWSEYRAAPRQVSKYCYDYLPIHLKESNRWDDLLELVASGDLDLLRRWLDGGEGSTGLECLIGLADYLKSNAREPDTAAGLATQIARIHSMKGDYAAAERWLRQALEELPRFKGRRIKAVALHELGSLYLYRRDFASSARFYRKALRLCRWGYPVYYDEAAANMIGLATLAWEDYRYDDAIRFAEAAIKKALKVNDFLHVIAGERVLGTAYKSLGCLSESREHLESALTLCELTNARREKYRILNLLGWLEYRIAVFNSRMPHEARALFEEALQGARLAYDYYYYIEAHLSLGRIALLEKNKAAADYHLSKTKGLLALKEHPDLQAGIRFCNAALMHLNGNFETADKLYMETIDSCKRHDLRSGHIKSLIGLGAIRWHKENRQAAEELWNQARNIAIALSNDELALAKHSIEICKNDPRETPR